MPDLGNAQAAFDKGVLEAEKVVSNVEALWQTAPRRSDVRRQIGERELSALYGMAYLSVFGHWESFVEECLTRMIAGQGSSSYTPVLLHPPRARTLKDARTRVLGNRRFLLWHDSAAAAARVAQHVTGSPLESTLLAAQKAIDDYAAIRHAIAHRSDDVLQRFEAASQALTGVKHSVPGRLLRTQDHADPLNPVRWLRKISSDMRQLALRATQ
jgi:hypothetical protein